MGELFCYLSRLWFGGTWFDLTILSFFLSSAFWLRVFPFGRREMDGG